MNQLKLKSLVRIKKYRAYRKQSYGIVPNILERNFKAHRPYQKWVTDITEFSLLGRKIYLSTILDLHNGEIVSYNYSSSPNYELVSTMLESALAMIPENKDLTLHSDQGWHYQMKAYQHALKQRGIAQSMSRKGNCLDNAVMESFFATLKSEFFYLLKFGTIEEFLLELDEYILYYNTKRIKAKLNGMSPVQYRVQHSLVS